MGQPSVAAAPGNPTAAAFPVHSPKPPGEPDDPGLASLGTPERPFITPGDLLAGRFQVLKFLGQGGMGEVFEVRDNVLQERIALKVVYEDSRSEESRLRLQREVQLARRVTHNNVCRIFDLVRHYDTESHISFDFVCMELLEGETLRDYFLRHGALPPGDALPILRQIARGLVAAHRLGIVHRDLKPSNVMLVDEPSGLRAAITDFGLAHSFGPEGRMDSPLTLAGELIGTPAYMAPEQTTDDPTSPATDIYSFGVIFYELLTGRLPFASDSGWKMMVDRLTLPPTPIAHHLPQLDGEIRDLVDQCLHRDPERRPASFSEILQRLDFGDRSWDVYGQKAFPGDGPAGASTAAPRSDSTSPPPAATATPAWMTTTGRWAPLLLIVLALISEFYLNKDSAPVDPQSFTLAHAAAPSTAELRRRVDTVLDRMQVTSPSIEVDAEPASESVEAVLRRMSEQLSRYDVTAALHTVRSGLDRHPDSPRLLTGLARALWRSGHGELARAVMQRAAPLAKQLPQNQRTPIHAWQAALSGDWYSAQQAFDTLRRLNVQPLENGLLALEASWFSGRVLAMESMVRSVRALPPPDAGDPRIDLWESWVAHDLGRFEDQASLARSALASPHPRVQFAARLSLSAALDGANQPAEQGRVVAELTTLAERLGDPVLRARALLATARHQDRLGEEMQAYETMRQADILWESAGSVQGRCWSHTFVGRLRSIEVGLRRQWLERGNELCAQGGFSTKQALTLYHLAQLRRDTAAPEEPPPGG